MVYVKSGFIEKKFSVVVLVTLATNSCSSTLVSIIMSHCMS